MYIGGYLIWADLKRPARIYGPQNDNFLVILRNTIEPAYVLDETGQHTKMIETGSADGCKYTYAYARPVKQRVNKVDIERMRGSEEFLDDMDAIYNCAKSFNTCLVS